MSSATMQKKSRRLSRGFSHAIVPLTKKKSAKDLKNKMVSSDGAVDNSPKGPPKGNQIKYKMAKDFEVRKLPLFLVLFPFLRSLYRINRIFPSLTRTYCLVLMPPFVTMQRLKELNSEVPEIIKCVQKYQAAIAEVANTGERIANIMIRVGECMPENEHGTGWIFCKQLAVCEQ